MSEKPQPTVTVTREFALGSVAITLLRGNDWEHTSLSDDVRREVESAVEQALDRVKQQRHKTDYFVEVNGLLPECKKDTPLRYAVEGVLLGRSAPLAEGEKETWGASHYYWLRKYLRNHCRSEAARENLLAKARNLLETCNA